MTDDPGLTTAEKAKTRLTVQTLRYYPHETSEGLMWVELPDCPHPSCDLLMQIHRTPFVTSGMPDFLCPTHGNGGMVIVQLWPGAKNPLGLAVPFLVVFESNVARA